MLDGFRFATKTTGAISIPIPLCHVIFSENNPSFKEPKKI
jgi:hypothetical protein